jgi:GTP pyrophosphokinase
MPDIKEITSLLKNPTEADLALVQKAHDFAKKAHDGQIRKSGEPYFVHLFATAKNIAELGMSATTVSAGFLHDTLEDTDVTPEELEKNFGKEILFLVEGVTKLGKIKYQGTARYNESLRKLFVAMSQDIRVLIIKLCDRLHNMQTLQFVPKEKQLRIATETLEIYAPIAYRLGIRKIHRQLEDLAFQYVYPEDYKLVKDLAKKKEGSELESLEKFNKLVKKELAQNDVINFHTEYRIKSLYSLYKKLKKHEMDIDKIYDVCALRIIVPTVTDCYKVLGIIHGAWIPLPDRIKDYIAFPKPNGYQSLHTTIFTGEGGIVEVQIRTEEMAREAEYGITSHIGYKERQSEGGQKRRSNPTLSWVKKILPLQENWNETGQKKTSLKLDDIPSWIKELVEYQKSAGEEFLDDAKTDFFEQRIFVFTPKGDTIDLPVGSSVIDFAYNIHSDIGDHMSGVEVNGKFVAIYTILKNGDRVKIETKKSGKPNYKWLEFCKTTVAKRHIRNFLENKS